MASVINNCIIAKNGLAGVDLQANNPLTEDYNLYYSNTGGNAGGFTPGANSILNQDPLFVNAGTFDFHLQNGSPVINKGTTPADAPTILTLYGINSAVDMDSILRPQQTVYDLGAYEYKPPTGIKNLIASDEPFIYPNPNNGYFSLRNLDNYNKMQISVYDLAGKNIFSKTETDSGIYSQPIDLSDLVNGVYLMEVIGSKAGEAQHFYKKIIISNDRTNN